jgi:5-methylcytosine-specific restriction endonuclease McrA
MPYKDVYKKRAYQREWKANRRQQWINDNGGVCVQCGWEENLQIDHIDPLTKTMEVSQVWSRRIEIRHKELSKCQILCVDCHDDKTSKENQDLAHSRITGGYIYFGTLVPEDCECKFCNEKKQMELW